MNPNLTDPRIMIYAFPIGVISLGVQMWITSSRGQLALNDGIGKVSDQDKRLSWLEKRTNYLFGRLLALMLSTISFIGLPLLFGVRAVMMGSVARGIGIGACGMVGLFLSAAVLIDDLRQRRIVAAAATIPLSVGAVAVGVSLMVDGIVDIGLALILGSVVPTIILWGMRFWREDLT